MKKELLINEEEAYPEIIRQIKKAQDSIYICMYIWRDDQIGNLVAEELIKAANRGVQVEILKDKAGAVFERVEKKKQSFFHKEGNIKLKFKEWIVSWLYYRDNNLPNKQFVNGKLNQILNHKNITVEFNKKRNDHSKFYIFDNRVLILGGMNIGDKEVESGYADYMVKFVDSELVAYFWKRLAGNQIKRCYQDIEFYFNIREQDRFEIKDKILDLLEEARYRIDIEMAYFGDKDITRKIIAAVQRGVNVTIITSRNSNVQNCLNQRVLQKMISDSNGGVKIYLANRLVHSKLMCIDRKDFFIGSANFHKLGMSKLSELNVLIKNADDLCDKWKRWRKDLLQDCKLICQKEKLTYNLLIALTERVVC